MPRECAGPRHTLHRNWVKVEKLTCDDSVHKRFKIHQQTRLTGYLHVKSPSCY
jgi:hypothetical protein